MIDRRASATAFATHGPLYQVSDRQTRAVSLHQRRQVHLGAVKALLIEAIDPYPVADGDFVADGPNVWRLRRHGSFPRMDASLPIARPHRLYPDSPSGTAHPAFEPPPKFHELAVIADDLRQHFRADHSHMAAAMAPKPDVVAFDHGIAKGLRRPVTEFGREPGECDVPFWAS